MTRGNERDEHVKVSTVAVDVEEFTSEYKVRSAHFQFAADGEQHVVTLSRSFGDDEDDDGVCLVLSPAQECVYDEFAAVTLRRDALVVRFTDRGQKVFECDSVLLEFSVDQVLWGQLAEALAEICSGKPFFSMAGAGEQGVAADA